MVDALRDCADLKAIFRRQAGAWLDGETLCRVRELCERASGRFDDPHARVEIARVARYAERLYDHRVACTDSLREQILLSLDCVEDRLLVRG